MERFRFHPPGRRCRIPGCITVLNHFNPGPCCLLHTERIEALGLVEPGLAKLWVAIEAKRRELDRRSRAAQA